jgi:SSS family solute:Na+ symporter
MFFTYLFGEMLLPFYSQRALLTQTPAGARKAFILAGCVAAIWYLVVSAAGMAARTVTSASDPEYVLVENFSSAFGASGLADAGLVAAFIGLLALTHSTFDSILNTGGVALSRDVLRKIAALSESQEGAVARRGMVVIAAFGLVVPFIWEGLIEILLIGYTMWAPTLMPIFGWMILTKHRKASPIVFWAGFLSGAGAWAVASALAESWLPAVAVGVAANVVALAFATRLTRSAWFSRAPA